MTMPLIAASPLLAVASTSAGAASWVGDPLAVAALAVFVLAFLAVTQEERTHMRKSVPVILAAGVIWILAALVVGPHHPQVDVAAALRHNLLEFAELFLFLLSAITYVNTLEERQVFDALRCWLVGRGFSPRQLFWVTGGMAFVMSPIADNLTTTLVMGAVAIAAAGNSPRFVGVACVNIVVAANAGGAFSPFGDITTLMVWQKGIISFTGFFPLIVPSLVTWLVPATVMSLMLREPAVRAEQATVVLRPGALVVVGMFVGTIAFTVLLHTLVDLPAALGMMTGLGALKLYFYFHTRRWTLGTEGDDDEILAAVGPRRDAGDTFDIFHQLRRFEWDTLMFFYGVILCVGGLGVLGYLQLMSTGLYQGLGPTWANVIVGVLSAIVDNIPVMFAVLSIQPDMSQNQWLLVTLTCGVGGSLLSVGSAAGVALMGQAKGVYTFGTHLRWAWAIALGYAAGIGAHLAINGH